MKDAMARIKEILPYGRVYLRACGICWRGDPTVRMHYCDLEAGHEEDHRCHCGTILKKPAKLAGRKP